MLILINYNTFSAIMMILMFLLLLFLPRRAIIWSVPLKLLVMSLCLITGFSIFAFYANCDPLLKGDIQKIDQIVPYFVVHELASIPGMMGIFTSCIFSAVLR